jgi:thiopeptide-type bacteriocin biosynthesis protein
LYVKIYGPADRQNDLLAGPLGELAPSLVRAGLADHWFVVRYADPAPHLRIRFHGDPAVLLQHVLPQLTALVGELINDGACTTMTVDSYERELERYGGPAAMTVAEAVFHVDSDSAVDLIEQSVDVDPIMLRVLSVDTFLGGLGLDPERRRDWYRKRTVDRRASSTEYRNHQAQLRQVLRSGRAGDGVELAAVLSARTARLRPLGERLLALATCPGGELTRDLDAIWASLVHMHLNRLAPPDAPSEPLVLGLLARTSDSLAHTAHLG